MKYEEIRIRLSCIYGLQVARRRAASRMGTMEIVKGGEGRGGSGASETEKVRGIPSSGSLLWKMALDVLLSDHLALSEIFGRFEGFSSLHIPSLGCSLE